MVGDDRAQIQQVHILDKDRFLVVSSTTDDLNMNAPQQQIMKLHQLNKLKLKTGSELVEARKKQFEDLKKKEQEAEDERDEESEEDDDEDSNIDKNSMNGFKGFGDINIIQSFPSYLSSQGQTNFQAQDQAQGQGEDQNQGQGYGQDLSQNQDQNQAQGQSQVQGYGQDQNQGQGQGYGQEHIQNQGQNQNQDQGQNQNKDESHTAISFDSHKLKLNIWDTKSAVKTKCFSLGFEPLMMTLVKSDQSERVLLLNGKKSKFVLLDLVDEEVVWESSERFITRHLVHGRNDKCVLVKATNEFVVMDERSKLKIFNMKTGKKSAVKPCLRIFFLTELDKCTQI